MIAASPPLTDLPPLEAPATPTGDPLRFALGVEELVCALRLLKAHQAVEDCLALSFPEPLPERVLQARLEAACHSLSAKGLHVEEAGLLMLEETLERALIPLIHYDTLLTGSLVGPQRRGKLLVWVINSGEEACFTIQQVVWGVVHRLEHGPLSALPASLLALLGLNPSANIPTPLPRLAGEITSSQLSGVLQHLKEPEKVVSGLKALGWGQEAAQEWVSALLRPVAQARITRIEAAFTEEGRRVRGAAVGSLYLLVGRRSLWGAVFQDGSPAPLSTLSMPEALAAIQRALLPH